MTMELSAPAPLTRAHNTSLFSCGEAVLDDWLRERAMKNEVSGASRTYVVCAENDVVGYYSLAVGSIEHQFAPGNIKRNMPQPIPAMILARLAVDRQYAGQNIGTGMLRDALLRTLQAADIAMFSIVIEIVKRPRASSCFTLLKRRWVVERTFGWFCKYRRLSKDYEEKMQSSENMIYIAMMQLMLKRLIAGKKRSHPS